MPASSRAQTETAYKNTHLAVQRFIQRFRISDLCFRAPRERGTLNAETRSRALRRLGEARASRHGPTLPPVLGIRLEQGHIFLQKMRREGCARPSCPLGRHCKQGASPKAWALGSCRTTSDARLFVLRHGDTILATLVCAVFSDVWRDLWREVTDLNKRTWRATFTDLVRFSFTIQSFHSLSGPAYLFGSAVNVSLGPAEVCREIGWRVGAYLMSHAGLSDCRVAP